MKPALVRILMIWIRLLSDQSSASRESMYDANDPSQQNSPSVWSPSSWSKDAKFSGKECLELARIRENVPQFA